MDEPVEEIVRALEPGSAITRRSNVPWKELDGVAVILNLDSGDYFELDEVGLSLWKSLESETTVAELATRLSHAYDVAPETAVADVTEFCQELLARNLVVVR